MTAQLVESVRAFLRGAGNKVTAKIIADEIEASRIDVGKALDELKGLHHADCDGLHRWHLTEKGRLAAGPEDGPATPSAMPAPGTIAARLLEAISTDGHTASELVTMAGLERARVSSNLASLRSRGLAHQEGERGGEGIWRPGGVRTLKPLRNKKCTQCGNECAPTSGNLCRPCYLANAEAKRNDRITRARASNADGHNSGDAKVGEVDHAAIAAGQDKEEAAMMPIAAAPLAPICQRCNGTGKYRERFARYSSACPDCGGIPASPSAILAALADGRLTTDPHADAEPIDVQTLIAAVCDELKALLLDKNRRYGNSALQPMRVFSKADPIEQINVRLDDKLSRLLSAQADDEEDAEFDLLGYLVLKRVAKKLQR